MGFFSIGNFDIGGISEEQVKELINQNNIEVVQVKIQDAVEDMHDHVADAIEAADDIYNDTRIYPTKQYMEHDEPVGKEDVLYIITDEDNTRYIWDKQEQKYSPIEGRIDNSQISDLFNS